MKVTVTFLFLPLSQTPSASKVPYFAVACSDLEKITELITDEAKIVSCCNRTKTVLLPTFYGFSYILICHYPLLSL